MIGALLFAAVVALPVVYRRGHRHGFERHMCVNWPPEADRAPTTWFPVRCVACGETIACELLVTSHGGSQLSIEMDTTDLKAHRALKHEGAV